MKDGKNHRSPQRMKEQEKMGKVVQGHCQCFSTFEYHVDTISLNVDLPSAQCEGSSIRNRVTLTPLHCVQFIHGHLQNPAGPIPSPSWSANALGSVATATECFHFTETRLPQKDR